MCAGAVRGAATPRKRGGMPRHHCGGSMHFEAVATAFRRNSASAPVRRCRGTHFIFVRADQRCVMWVTRKGGARAERACLSKRCEERGRGGRAHPSSIAGSIIAHDTWRPGCRCERASRRNPLPRGRDERLRCFVRAVRVFRDRVH